MKFWHPVIFLFDFLESRRHSAVELVDLNLKVELKDSDGELDSEGKLDLDRELMGAE